MTRNGNQVVARINFTLHLDNTGANYRTFALIVSSGDEFADRMLFQDISSRTISKELYDDFWYPLEQMRDNLITNFGLNTRIGTTAASNILTTLITQAKRGPQLRRSLLYRLSIEIINHRGILRTTNKVMEMLNGGADIVMTTTLTVT